MRIYKQIPLNSKIAVKTLINSSVVNINKDTIFKGESHNFWEFQYMSEGSAIIHKNNEFYELEQGQMAFFKPEEFHILWGNGKTGAKMYVFAFYCDNEEINFLSEIVLKASQEIVSVIKSIYLETQLNYDHVNDLETGALLKSKNDTVFGYEQIIKNKLEELLILLIRRYNTNPKDYSKKTNQKSDKMLAEQIHLYLKNNTNKSVCLTNISKQFNFSVTYMKKVYKKYYGIGIISNLNLMKLDMAKKLLNETSLLIKNISEDLSFANLYHFSNWFKKYVGMSPTDYRKESKE